MDPAKVSQTAELLGLEERIGTGTPRLSIGHASKDFIAGALSGMVGVAAGQPLDTLRIRLQQAGCRQRSVAAVWRAMSRAGEGVHGLFRGMSYPVSTTALQNAVTFQAQGAASRLLAGSADRSAGVVSWQHTCLAGMFAGAVQTAISSPVELLKIRLQLQHALPGRPGYVGPVQMLRQVLAQDGPAGLGRGFLVTLARDTPSYGLYFCSYHWLVQGLGCALQALRPAGAPPAEGQQRGDAGQGQGQQQPLQQREQQQQQQQQREQRRQELASEPAVQFFAGGIAGAVAWASVYAIDVVKTRMQATPARSSPYRGPWHCAAASWRAEGPGVFFRGLGATVGRGFVVNAAIFASFEALMEAMWDV